MGLHHAYEDGPCRLCEFKLKDGHPFFRDLWPKLKNEFPHVHISCVARSAEDQELAFQQGRSRLRHPSSDHNKVDSYGQLCSRAIDLFFLNADGLAVFPPFQYLRVAEWLETNNYPVGCGIHWEKFRDAPHFFLKESIKQP